jgi:hypothetical protein
MAPFPYCLSIWVTAKSTALPLLGSTFESTFIIPPFLSSAEEIPNYKTQIPNKFQIPISNDRNFFV